MKEILEKIKELSEEEQKSLLGHWWKANPAKLDHWWAVKEDDNKDA